MMKPKAEAALVEEEADTRQQQRKSHSRDGLCAVSFHKFCKHKVKENQVRRQRQVYICTLRLNLHIVYFNKAIVINTSTNTVLY